jgi:xanthine dehydrogenase accessory factor
MSINSNKVIWIRGAGEIGSAVAISLFKSGFNILLSEINPPLAIRRTVTFSDAIVDSETSVMGIHSKHMEIDQYENGKQSSFIPLLLDNPDEILTLSPKIVIDARMIKTYNEDFRDWADLFVGYGPGFSTYSNCHVCIETMRGHYLGKLVTNGTTKMDTGVPGALGGESSRRVIYAKNMGTIIWHCTIGDMVEEGQCLGSINNTIPIKAPFSGMVRGLIHPSVSMTPGLKVADIDPRGADIDYNQLSDKARSLGRAGLEAVLIYLNNHS